MNKFRRSLSHLVPAAARGKLKPLPLSRGNKDRLISISLGVRAFLKQDGIARVWNVDDRGHDGESWNTNLYHFAQMRFR